MLELSPYLDPFTDFGFKKLFGEEANKDLLLAFLNALLPAHHQIKDLSYSKNEQVGRSAFDRKAIFDIYCISNSGEHFIVELQRAKQNYFKDRSVFYATFPIQQQGHKAQWSFKLSAVYLIGILDFVFPDDAEKTTLHTVELKDQNNQVFYDKLCFYYITLPNFNKTLEQLQNQQDKWFYLLKNLSQLLKIPHGYTEEHFLKLFNIAEVAKLPKPEYLAYEESLKVYRDNKNTWDYAIEEAEAKGEARGEAKGKAEGEHQTKLAIARNMKAAGLSLAQISQLTGLGDTELTTLLH
jgi:predicted transposase/invertase (TIGR01784 family)